MKLLSPALFCTEIFSQSITERIKVSSYFTPYDITFTEPADFKVGLKYK